jgi:aryl-alcohol dehydrogenase-like predicted oxidoreductase
VRYTRLPGIELELSTIVMGTVHPRPALWEAFLDAGGTCFDTARHYGDESEGELGRFLERRGTRGSTVVVGKAAHPPDCRPDAVRPELDRSLELLRTDRVDLLLLHRDDRAIPVGEFADALDAEVAAGRAGAVGLSNWSPERFEAFNAYARRHGRAPAAVLSNQLSLAEMLEPMWDGCLQADPAWHERTRTPLLAWSAQARGFFSGRPEDGELRRSWLSEANRERRRRAEELGARLGVTAVTVALAWVLAHRFPSWAVVGPADRDELDDCLAAAEVELEPADARRLFDV